MTTHGEIRWPPVGSSDAAYGEISMAAVTREEAGQRGDPRPGASSHSSHGAGAARRIDCLTDT